MAYSKRTVDKQTLWLFKIYVAGQNKLFIAIAIFIMGVNLILPGYMMWDIDFPKIDIEEL